MERKKITQRRGGRRGFAEKRTEREERPPQRPAGPINRVRVRGDRDEFVAWDAGAAATRRDCGVEAGIDWVAVDRAAGGMVGGKDGAGAWIWMHRGYFDRVDRVGDWGMGFYTGGDYAREYVFVFLGGRDGWGGALSIGRTFVFWGKELGEPNAETWRTQRRGK